jgi:mRNA-degrading endonuclease RelE of RelBE toxin-antitoxin system
VVKYTLEIKQSAQKELDALDDTVFRRIDRKMVALADNPRAHRMEEAQGLKRSVAHSDR